MNTPGIKKILLFNALFPGFLFAQAQGKLQPVGLQGLKVTALGFYNSIYAGTDGHGVFRHAPAGTDTNWIAMGLEGKKILTVYPHKFGPIGFAVSAGVQPDWSRGDSALVYCAIFDQTEWVVTDSGLNRREVPWIRSLDGFPDESVCGETFAAGPGRVFRRYFNSTHWEKVLDIGVGVTHAIRAHDYSGHVWAGGGTAIRTSWLARTKDKGASWEVSFPFLDFLTTCRALAIHPSNSDIVYAALEEGVIQTTDGGKNWKLTGLRVPSAVFDAIVIDPISPNRILAGGSSASLTWELWESFDAGSSWKKIPSPLSAPSDPLPAISSIIVAPDTLGAFLIGTLGNGVWRYQSFLTAVEEENSALPEGLVLEQNYPNPFNSETGIHYRLAAVQHVKVEIYDVSGHLLLTLADAVHPPGEYETHWNGRDENGALLPSGVYFCRMRGGANAIAARKVMLLR